MQVIRKVGFINFYCCYYYYYFLLLLFITFHNFITFASHNNNNNNNNNNYNIVNVYNNDNTNIIGPEYGIRLLNRTNFPGFLFGAASAAYQYEGAVHEDGRGPSIWDTYTHKFPEGIADGSNGDVTEDSYHRYKEDVRILKEMGLDAYRFSISWPRVLPHGKASKGVNRKGIDYYHNLIDELLKNDIVPFITIFHFDLPQALEDEYDGFLSPLIVDDFRDYADLCFKEFGDKVKYWITINEPFTYSKTDFIVGINASIQCLKSKPETCAYDYATQPYLAAHYQLLSHAAAVQVYRLKYQESKNGIIGIVLNCDWFVPYSQTQQDHNAAFRALDFMFGWYMDPITYGDYPKTMRSLVQDRLPKFTPEQSMLLKASYDFVGLNYYTSTYAADAPSYKKAPPNFKTDSLVNLTSERNGIPIGPQAASEWLYVVPSGIHNLLLHIMRKYNNPLIYITENGIDESNNPRLPLDKALADSWRIDYLHSHLAFIQYAVEEGVKLGGYFVWSLLDNFEWDDGFTVRFGLYYVNYTDLQRYPKQSAKWFQNFLRA